MQKTIDAGLIVVASAGNYGKVTIDGKDVPVYGGIASPGNLPDVITVGALNTKGTPNRYRRCGDDVQLEGADGDRPGDQARPGGARQQGVGGAGGRQHRGRDRPGGDASTAGSSR